MMLMCIMQQFGHSDNKYNDNTATTTTTTATATRVATTTTITNEKNNDINNHNSNGNGNSDVQIIKGNAWAGGRLQVFFGYYCQKLVCINHCVTLHATYCMLLCVDGDSFLTPSNHYSQGQTKARGKDE